MKQTFTSLFRSLSDPKFPAGLHERIVLRVMIFAQRRARVQAAAWAFVAFISGISLAPMTRYVLQTLSNSGFFQYAGLMFSDWATVISLWRDFIVLLGETFPFVQATGLLVLFLVCLVSLRATVRFMPQALGKLVLAP